MSAERKSRWEPVMWVCLGVCLVAGLTTWLRDAGSVVPFVIAAMIAANIGWMRHRQPRAGRR
jgi:hypothetical protein